MSRTDPRRGLELDEKIEVEGTGEVGYVAILGDETVTVEVPTEDGPTEFTVPHATASRWAA